MTVTIDGEGRLVIPKEILGQAHLEPGAQLRITFRDGRIEIEPVSRQVEIVGRGQLRVAVPSDASAPLTDEVVRSTRDRVRERDG